MIDPGSMSMVAMAPPGPSPPQITRFMCMPELDCNPVLKDFIWWIHGKI